MAVSQSNTMWVKKGTVVNGKKVKKGYVAQKGRPEKRVTNKIKLVVDTDKRGKAGETVQTKKGRYVKSSKNKVKVEKPKPKSKGGGYTGNGPSGGKAVVRPTTTPPPKPPKDKDKTDRPKDTTQTDTGYENKGDRKATSATVSGAQSKTGRKPQLGGKNKKYTPGREEPGQNKGNAKPKSRLDKIGERGPIGTAADAAKAAGKGASKFMDKYGPNSDWAKGEKSKKPIKIGTVQMMGNPPKKYRRTKNGWVLVK